MSILRQREDKPICNVAKKTEGEINILCYVFIQPYERKGLKVTNFFAMLKRVAKAL